MRSRRCQRTPFQVMRPDCELTTLMAAARGALEGELRADVGAQFRLVVNESEPHLASLDDGEPAGRCYSQRKAPGRAAFQPWPDLPLRPGTAPRWRNSCSLGQYPAGSRGLSQTTGPKMANPRDPNLSSACPCRATNAAFSMAANAGPPLGGQHAEVPR
jgi:hypothetical protein